MKTVVCFGEIMARLSPRARLRLQQAMPGELEVTFAGAEANVAVILAQLGASADFVSAFPRNAVAEACAANLRAAGVGVERLRWLDHGRFGVFFLEPGSSQRSGEVLYDRDGTSFAVAGPDDYPWEAIFRGAGWFHFTGIAAGVSAVAADATQAAVARARATGLTVSCDLNFRRKLWQWRPGTPASQLFAATMAPLLESADLLVGNACDLAAVLGETFVTDPADPESHRPLLRRCAKRFPRLRWIALTLRQTRSADHHAFGALLYLPAEDRLVFAPRTGDGARYAPYEIGQIVDRLGTGDAFTGALIFALNTPELAAPERAVAFASAASCFAHTVHGDFCWCRRAEIESLMNGNTGGHVSR